MVLSPKRRTVQLAACPRREKVPEHRRQAGWRGLPLSPPSEATFCRTRADLSFRCLFYCLSSFHCAAVKPKTSVLCASSADSERAPAPARSPDQPGPSWWDLGLYAFHFPLQFLFLALSLRLLGKYSLLYVCSVPGETGFPSRWAFQKFFQCFCKTNPFIAAHNIPQKAWLQTVSVPSK